MRIVLSGQRTFGLVALKAIEERGDDIAAVFAPLEGRLAGYADMQGHRVEAAGTLRSTNLPNGTDLIVAAHSHDFISRRARLVTAYGALGYHPSLLPLHRGRDAVRWAVRLRDRIAGGTVFWLNDTVDGGPIAKQDWCFVEPGDTVSTLWRRELFPMGIRLLISVLNDVDAGIVVRVPQDPALATWEPSMDGAPRLWRPELTLIGDRGYSVVTDHAAARSAGQHIAPG